MKKTKLIRCIYCDPEGKPSREHYLPEGLGRFKDFETLNNRICVKCNNRIGDLIETPFLRTGLIGFLRWHIGISDSITTPSPFYYGAGGEPRLSVIGTLPNSEIEVLWECVHGTNDLTPERQVVMQHRNGSFFQIPVKNWVDDQMSLVKQIREKAREGFDQLTTYHEDYEEDAVRALYSQIGGQLEFTTMDWKTQKKIIPIPFQKTTTFKRAIAKIAFHYALKCFPNITGREPQFDLIRRAIIDGVSDWSFIRENTLPLDPNYRHNLEKDQWIHILKVAWGKDNIKAHVRLFDKIDSQVIAYDLVLGTPPTIVIPAQHSIAHQYVYYREFQGSLHGYMEPIAIPQIL